MNGTYRIPLPPDVEPAEYPRVKAHAASVAGGVAVTWTDEEDERQYAGWQRRMAGDGLTSYRECQRWRMAFWLATAVAGIQTVVIAAMLIGRWLQWKP